MNEKLIDFAIYKLTQLQIKAHFENEERGKVRYVSKTQVYKDLIELLKNIKKEMLD